MPSLGIYSYLRIEQVDKQERYRYNKCTNTINTLKTLHLELVYLKGKKKEMEAAVERSMHDYFGLSGSKTAV